MYKSIYGIVFLFVLILSGCKEEEAAKISSIEEDYKVQIEELKKENKRISDELSQFDDYSVHLQIADRNSRKIMRFIRENDFAQLKSELGIEATISDGKVFFEEKTHDEYETGLPIEQAAFHMSIAYFNIYDNSLEIGYFLDDLNADVNAAVSYSVTFGFDKNGEFIYFENGDA